MDRNSPGFTAFDRYEKKITEFDKIFLDILIICANLVK